jgi:hypothetical protein
MDILVFYEPKLSEPKKRGEKKFSCPQLCSTSGFFHLKLAIMGHSL